MKSISLSLNLSKTAVLLDILSLLFVYCLPTLSHWLSYPLYYFEPMRITLFTSIFIFPDRRNAYFLAITLPLFSFLVSGHPVAIKNVIMAVELIANIFFLFYLSNKIKNSFVVCLLSILISKLLYYGLKYVAIFCGLLTRSIVDTPILVQSLVAVVLSVIFVLNIKNRHLYGK